MSDFLATQPSHEPPTGDRKEANYPFYMDYNTEFQLVILNSSKQPAEEQPQYVKSHLMSLTSKSGKPYSKRLLCPDHKRNLESEESICVMCAKFASMTKEERASAWKKGFRAKQELPLSVLIIREDENGEVIEQRKVRFSSDRREDRYSEDTRSDEQKFLAKVLETAKKKKLGKDIRGLKFTVTRGSDPKDGPKPAGVGELGISLEEGVCYHELDDSNENHQPYTMAEIMDEHYITDDSEIEAIMAEAVK